MGTITSWQTLQLRCVKGIVEPTTSSVLAASTASLGLTTTGELKAAQASGASPCGTCPARDWAPRPAPKPREPSDVMRIGSLTPRSLVRRLSEAISASKSSLGVRRGVCAAAAHEKGCVACLGAGAGTGTGTGAESLWSDAP